MPHYPVYLDLAGRPCAIFGGCAMAEEKARGLLAAGARLTVVAPELTPALAELAASGSLHHEPRHYRPGDLAGVFLAVVTVPDRPQRDALWSEAEAGNVLLNTVDDVPRCNFIAPAVVRRGDLAVAISTGGKAPALAVRLRQELEGSLGDEHARFLDLAGRVRAPLARRHPDFATRRELWYRLVDSDVLDLLRHGDEGAALARFEEILGVLPTPAPSREAVPPAFPADVPRGVLARDGGGASTGTIGPAQPAHVPPGSRAAVGGGR